VYRPTINTLKHRPIKTLTDLIKRQAEKADHVHHDRPGEARSLTAVRKHTEVILK